MLSNLATTKPNSTEMPDIKDVYTPAHKHEIFSIINSRIQKAEKEHALLLASLSEASINASDGVDRASNASATMELTDKLSRNSGLLRKLYSAKNKLESGDYGICENETCGEHISLKRLRIRPQARFCITCAEIKEREEKARQRRRH